MSKEGTVYAFLFHFPISLIVCLSFLIGISVVYYSKQKSKIEYGYFTIRWYALLAFIYVLGLVYRQIAYSFIFYFAIILSVVTIITLCIEYINIIKNHKSVNERK
jgi:hypothetical protein